MFLWYSSLEPKTPKLNMSKSPSPSISLIAGMSTTLTYRLVLVLNIDKNI